MPYNNGEGLHDAYWRYYFYHTDGSHGCVNMPYDMAAYVYTKVNSGTNVLVEE